MAPNPVRVGGHLTPRGHHSHADALETPNPYQDTHDDRRPFRDAVSVSERPSSPKGHPRSRGVNPMRRHGGFSASGSSPLTRGQRRACRHFRSSSRIIPAHAGSTHSKPRNPVVTSTLAVTTDATGHPVEQPSVSDRARAEGLAAKAGRTSAGKPKHQAGDRGRPRAP